MKILQTSTLAMALVVAAAPLALASASMSKDSLKREIELDGYTNVSNLRQESNGWMANAQESGKPVKLFINSHGDIAKR